MNQEIKKRIDAIGNKDAVKLFFELVNDLITHLGLDADNEKLALNIPKNTIRMCAIINDSNVLFLKKDSTFKVMLNERDLGQIEYDGEPEMRSRSQARLVFIKFDSLKNQLEKLKPLWFQSCSDYFSMGEKSVHRPIHISELYDLAINPVLLNPYFEKTTILVDDKNKAIPSNLKKGSNPSTTTMAQPLNQILFGPPGTGKTYNTINKALEIIGENIEGKTRKEIKDLFDAKMTEGQIVFTTFHQSMSYEDFIEGIKPETIDNSVIYNVKDGIFKEICNNASEVKTDNFDDAYESFINDLTEKETIELETNTQKKKFFIRVNSNKNCLVTPQTLSATPMTVTKNMIKSYILEKKVLDWKPYTIPIADYLMRNFPVKSAEKKKDTTNSKNYVLIIDEINRGNVSQIFGELITLIEDDKRLGKSEALEVTLPYSKETFGVPSNLYIIGTMNTADRSVEALDAALRRRFSFEEMPPKYDLDGLKYEIAGINAADILQTINQRIEKLLDKDHAIGHAYFLQKENTPSVKTLQNSFYKSIIPLLQEYFFGDYGKIGLVLGRGFVQRKKQAASFADFDYESASEFEDRAVFEIIDYRNPNNDLAFENALKLLMNQKIE